MGSKKRRTAALRKPFVTTARLERKWGGRAGEAGVRYRVVGSSRLRRLTDQEVETAREGAQSIAEKSLAH